MIKNIVSLFALVVLLHSCSSDKEEKKDKTKQGANAPVVVDVLIAGATSLNNTIEANGTVIASEAVELRPEISGRLTYLNIPEGKTIGAGTVIARINDADIRAQIAKQQAQLGLAEKQAERFKKLAEIGGLSQSEYDIAVNQIATIKADINFQYAQLAKTVVKAPFGGVVGLKQVSPGAYVTPQTILATLQQTNQVKIDFTLPQEYGNTLKPGSAVTVVANETNQKLRATVLAIEPQIEQTTRNLKVRALLQNQVQSPGSFVKVYVEQSKERPVILIPSNAIIPEANGKKVVLVKNGKADIVKVETGVRKEKMVAIEEGIEPGDSVVVSGVLFAKPKADLKVRKVVSSDQINNQ